MHDFDLIIIGGGCAGLSLGKILAQTKSSPLRTLILEARSAYTNDRTWCFWKNDQLPHQPLIKHEWGTLRVTCAQGEVVLNNGDMPYQMLPSDVFYEDATGVIDRSHNVTLLKNMTVGPNIHKINGKWVVEANQDTFTATAVVDTRPTKHPASKDAILWQSFVGQEIECDADVFDVNLAQLMDFSPPHPSRIQFTYVLPTTPRRALIETTVFGPDPLKPEVLQSDLDASIEQRVAGSFKIMRTEHGILPMGMAEQPQNIDKTYVTVGLNAGGARASTGYAFQRIQQWASSCAENLISGANPIEHARDPALLRMMDQLFLRVLKANCQKAPQMFLALFKGVETDRVIRFLSDQGTTMDYLKIISSLPPKPFLRELMRSVSTVAAARSKVIRQ